MRTALFILAGLAVLATLLWLSPAARRAPLALGFVGLWLVVSGINLSVGLSRGYALKEELLVHLFLFGIPAAAALFAWRHFNALR